MDILENVNTNVSSMVTSSFDDFISSKVKEEVEKEKEKFLKDLNMYEEEYPVFDEKKHKKFEACKLVNDNSLPFQSEPMQTLGLCSNQEFILKAVKIGPSSLNISNTIIPTDLTGSGDYFITNKGNVYQNSFMGSRAKGNQPILYNYKVLDYLEKSSCCGKALKREIVNGGWVISGEMSNNDVTKNCHASYDKKWIISLSAAVDGCGCGYNSLRDRAAPRLQGTDYQHLRSPELYCHYEDHVGWMEDCIDRFMTNNICPDCGSGEVIQDKLDPDIDIEIFRNPPIFNNEYIELLELLSKKGVTIPIYQIQTIYAKYHPMANENFVIEGKLKKLNDIEEVVNGRVSQKVAEEKACLKNEKEIYSEKIKQLNEEKLKRIFSMFILRNEKKRNIDEKKNNDNDKNTIREMINHTKERCNQKETNWNVKMEKEREEFEKEKEEFEKEKEEYRKKVSGLIDIANDINELNEEQDDKSCKSTDIFNIIKKLKELSDIADPSPEDDY
jgi:hypothetical protein